MKKRINGVLKLNSSCFLSKKLHIIERNYISLKEVSKKLRENSASRAAACKPGRKYEQNKEFSKSTQPKTKASRNQAEQYSNQSITISFVKQSSG